MALEPKKITLNGAEYCIGRLDLFSALQVGRKVAPLLPVIFHETMQALANAIIQSKAEDGASIEDKLSEVGNVLNASQPVLEHISKMDSESFDFVVKTCLGVVERKTGKVWAKICGDGVLVFDDIDMPTALVLILHVLWRELRPTISALNL